MGFEQKFLKRPGGPLQGKPVEGLNGQWYNQFGEKIEDPRKNQLYDKDVDYAQKFWSKGQPEGLREAMIESIQNSIKDGENEGVFSIFVNQQGLDENDKMKMSAYRQLAKENGYEISQFQFNAKTHNARAKITKIEQQK